MLLIQEMDPFDKDFFLLLADIVLQEIIRPVKSDRNLEKHQRVASVSKQKISYIIINEE